MKYNSLTKTVLVFVFFFFVGSIAAQPGGPDEDPDSEEAPLDPVPIGDYVIPMFIVGVATAFVLLKKRDPMVKKS